MANDSDWFTCQTLDDEDEAAAEMISAAVSGLHAEDDLAFGETGVAAFTLEPKAGDAGAVFAAVAPLGKAHVDVVVFDEGGVDRRRMGDVDEASIGT